MPTAVRWHGMRKPAGPGHTAVLLAELGRALAAERRYHALKHGGAAARADDGLATADVARRIFEEYYAGDRPRGKS
jgi:hypothetical protein